MCLFVCKARGCSNRSCLFENRIYDRHPELGHKFEGDFWARGYYVSTIGNVDEATIRKYIREQEEESYKEARTMK